MRYNTGLKGTDNCSPPPLHVWAVRNCSLMQNIAACRGIFMMWSAIEATSSESILLMPLPVLSLPTWVLSLWSMCSYFTLCPCFPGSPTSPLAPLWPLRHKEMSQFNLIQTVNWFFAKQLKSSTNLHARKSRMSRHPRWTWVRTLNTTKKKIKSMI